MQTLTQSRHCLVTNGVAFWRLSKTYLMNLVIFLNIFHHQIRNCSGKDPINSLRPRNPLSLRMAMHQLAFTFYSILYDEQLSLKILFQISKLKRPQHKSFFYFNLIFILNRSSMKLLHLEKFRSTLSIELTQHHEVGESTFNCLVQQIKCVEISHSLNQFEMK